MFIKLLERINSEATKFNDPSSPRCGQPCRPHSQAKLISSLSLSLSLCPELFNIHSDSDSLLPAPAQTLPDTSLNDHPISQA